jgi:hypothetical protein
MLPSPCVWVKSFLTTYANRSDAPHNQVCEADLYKVDQVQSDCIIKKITWKDDEFFFMSYVFHQANSQIY